jgi:hypothetical protein
MIDAARLYGEHAIWKDVGKRLLDITCRERRGSREDDVAGEHLSSRVAVPEMHESRAALCSQATSAGGTATPNCRQIYGRRGRAFASPVRTVKI